MEAMEETSYHILIRGKVLQWLEQVVVDMEEMGEMQLMQSLEVVEDMEKEQMVEHFLAVVEDTIQMVEVILEVVEDMETEVVDQITPQKILKMQDLLEAVELDFIMIIYVEDQEFVSFNIIFKIFISNYKVKFTGSKWSFSQRL